MTPEEQEVSEQFTYQAPTDSQVERITEIRAAGKALAMAIMRHAPKCADRTAAIRKVREAVMTANAAIVLE